MPADDQLKVGFEADEKLAPDGGEMRPGDTTLTTDTAVGGNGVGVSGSRSGVAVGTRVRVGVAVRVRFAVGVGAVVSVGVAFVAVLVTVGVRVVVAGLVIVASTIFWGGAWGGYRCFRRRWGLGCSGFGYCRKRSGGRGLYEASLRRRKRCSGGCW